MLSITLIGKKLVSGFSAGGELAAFLGTTQNMSFLQEIGCDQETLPHVNTIIDMDGTLSFVLPESGEGDDPKSTSTATHWFGYSKQEAPVLWTAASPLSYVGQKHTANIVHK